MKYGIISIGLLCLRILPTLCIEIVSEAFEELFSGRTVSPKEKGSIMKFIRPTIAGRADGKLVNMIVTKYMEKYS